MECSLFVKQSCLGKGPFYWFKNWFLSFFFLLLHITKTWLTNHSSFILLAATWTVSLNLLTEGCLMEVREEEVGTFGQRLFKILLKVSSGFLWTFGNLYFESLGVIIVIIINHQLPDPIETQNIGKVKAVENSTILHRRYEALTFWCSTSVTKIVMKTENSTRLMCSHDKNYHKEKRQWSKLNPFLPQKHSDEMVRLRDNWWHLCLTQLRMRLSFLSFKATKETN